MAPVQTDREARRWHARTGTFEIGGLRGSAPQASAPPAAQAPVLAAHGKEREAGLSNPALTLVLVASFMVVLDFSIVNVALPSIRQALGFGGDSVQWIVTAYAITFGGLLILGGRIANAGTFFLLGSLSLVAVAYFWKKVPETKGLTLEEIEREMA